MAVVSLLLPVVSLLLPVLLLLPVHRRPILISRTSRRRRRRPLLWVYLVLEEAYRWQHQVKHLHSSDYSSSVEE